MAKIKKTKKNKRKTRSSVWWKENYRITYWHIDHVLRLNPKLSAFSALCHPSKIRVTNCSGLSENRIPNKKWWFIINHHFPGLKMAIFFLGVNPPLLAVPNPPHPQFLVQVHKICQLTSNKGSQGGIWRDRRLGRNIGPVVVQKRSLRAPRTQEAGVLQDSFIHV